MKATRIRTWASATLVIIIAASVPIAARTIIAHAASDTLQEKTDRSRVAFTHDLPHLNGDKLNVTIVEVNYGPGESSAPHTHPCPVIGYVLEGTLRTKVQGEPEAIYKAGETFYEAPNGVHEVSANASDKVPAKLLAYFICDQRAPLSAPASEAEPEGDK